MKPPPLQRWKSFWFGAIVLAFLGWASWQSFGPRYLFGWDTGSHSAGFARMNGATYFMTGWHGTAPGLVSERLMEIPPPALVRHWRKEGIGVTRIPDLVTVLLFVLAWIGWLAWLERRGRNGIPGQAVG
ncbi:hypothetical protein [Luteolibacter marinus]|uniref:hypothetical protein n=1 Tax=Luteolibacter marinus TaxID=2776705 RepID=UPI0018668711|nr:hypothetical protein [Luteolibacter marinus]